MLAIKQQAGRKTAAGGGSFDPLADVGWHHAHWTEDPDWTQPADGGDVLSWRDGTGGGLDLTNPGSEPLTVPYFDADGGPNSKPAICMDPSDGISDGLQTTYGSAVAQPCSYVAVGLERVVSDGGYLYTDGGNSPRTQIYTGYKFRLNAGSNADLGPAPNTSPHLIVSMFNGSSTVLEIDGTTYGPGNAGTGTASGAVIGSSSAYGNGSNMNYSFFGFYSGDVRLDPGWADFEAWVASHYGITIA